MTNNQYRGWKDILALAVPARSLRAPGILLGIIADSCVIALLALSMWLIVRAAEQPPILYLNFAIVGVRAIAIGRAAFRYVERLASHDAAFAQIAKLRANIFDELVPRLPETLAHKRRGQVLSGFVDDIDQLQDETLRVRQPLITSTVVLLLSCSLIAVVSVRAAVITLLFMLLAAVVSVFIARKISAATENSLSSLRAELTDALLERTEAAPALQVYKATNISKNRILAAEKTLARVQHRQANAAGINSALLAFCAACATIAVLLLCRQELLTGTTAAAFAVVVIVPSAIAEVFAQAPHAINSRARVIASAKSVADIASAKLQKQIAQNRQDLDFKMFAQESADTSILRAEQAKQLIAANPKAPAIAVNDLQVQQPGSEKNIIDNLTFTVGKGETLVITGVSGSGKTTLAKTLVRFLEYDGSYEIYGQQAKQLGAQIVRMLVGLCEQNPHIFDASLRQNLLFAKPSASNEELMQVLQRVGLAEWAEARGGLDTELGYSGQLISGGQAQRIALARVLLADFSIVILDEPTAGVDKHLADKLLTDLVSAVPEHKALILITHTNLPESLKHKTLQL